MSNAPISLTIDGRAFDARVARGHEAVGEHFRIQVAALGKADKASDLVGKAFELQLHSPRNESLTITGIVTRVASIFDGHTQRLDLELGPEAALLAQGRGSHVYLDKTCADIGAAVLSRAGVRAARWKQKGTLPKRPYTAQYLEDDWSFVDRITREDGLYWFYDHDGGTTLVFEDDSPKAAAVDGAFLHRMHHGVGPTSKWVASIASRTTAVSNAFTTRDRDPLKPKVSLEGRATEGDGKLEVYAWPARVSADVGDAGARAKTSLEALRARRSIVTGESDSLDLRCGKIFTIEETSLPEAFRELFCIALDWVVSTESGTEVRFTAVPSKVPFRLPLSAPGRVPLGAENAFVRGAQGQEIDADKHARVFVQPTWDREGKKDDTCTIRSRVGQPALARSMVIPRIGWSMLVGHHDGDIDRPWVMARLVDGTHPPPYKLPDEMTKTSWQTLTSPNDGTLSEIVFEDKRDAEQIRVVAARDMAVEIGNDEARTVGNRHVLEVTENRTVTVEADEKLTVTKDQSTTVKGAESTTIEGSRSITIKGKEEISIQGNRTEKTKADRTSDIGKKRTLTVGGTMSASAKKTFTREVLDKLTATAGGAWTTQADGGLVVTTKGDAEETIGGARTSNGKDGVQTLVKGDLDDTIAAAHAVTAKGSVGESSKGKMKLTVGAAMTATAPEIEIVADSEIAIAVGPSTITIKSNGVEISAPTLAISGPLLSTGGAQVKHNP